MSPQLRGIRFSSPRSQRGAIGLMAALTFGLVLLFMLLVVDSGRLYLEQRKLQRVADVAVLEAVSRGGNCLATGTNTATTYAIASATRNNFPPGSTQTLSATCGTLVTGSDMLRTFSADASKSDAIRVITTTVVPTSVAGGLWNLFSNGKFGFNTRLTASAVGASPSATLAQISIRSTLTTISTNSQAAVLNAVIGGLAGGSLNLSVAGWNGLINSDINLLSYLNQLAIDLKLTAGDYTNLLAAKTTLTQLIQTAATVMDMNGATADVKAALLGLQTAVKLNPAVVTLGDLLKLNTGSSTAGLDANLQLIQMIQAFLQVANANNAVALTLPVDIPGVLSVNVRLKVIEPPQFSIIGDPGKQTLQVSTAQVRALISLNVPLLSNIAGLTNAVTDLVGSLTPVLNSLLSLNLVDTLGSALCLLGAGCQQLDTVLLPTPQIDISIDAASATAKVTGYTCPSGSDNTKSLTLSTTKSLATLRAGKIDPVAAFASNVPPTAQAVPIVDIGIKTCHRILGFLGTCGARVPFAGGGIALTVNAPLGSTPPTANAQTLIFSKNITPDATPPNLKLPPAVRSLAPTNDVVNSLSTTLSGVKIQAYAPSNSNPLSTVVGTATTAISGVVTLLLPTLTKLLGALVDPIVNSLLKNLGISLVDVQVGANLTCGQGGRAQLVL
ncbi:pilus assembly protein TadG-related protein [Pseudomonas sp. WS 5071]|uniref:pilus assembly protein TadG-related protein n=1 Tax=Pseudomonas sp. WS 5071 TaxID=2717479 RepID=UPI001472CEC2|nr:pilus assembly protein TadG-related protein [Pseudomonas sp. WS 5071]NMY72917.1 hypothetical protein [Pseudomonas sp. WS 5071]